MDNRFLNGLCLTLIVIGAINWGLVGFFQFDLVAAIFGGMSSWVSRVIYALIGLAGLYSLSFFRLFDHDRNRVTS
ncbi:MAG: DUF378 domain-containing protein [Clostridiales bacterium]|jgi:uncharacterized membrane protein YuzA (DUF378 family)|nr:DUF378 domain-containing protein [Clostridiales bacterium]